MKITKHTIETAQKCLDAKNLDFRLVVTRIDHDRYIAVVTDPDYGQYNLDLKSLCPSMAVPIHKNRRFQNVILSRKNHYVGQVINGCKILDVFYGKDRGYKNRSFYLEYEAECGHICIASYATLSRHKKNFKCTSCAKLQHGERGKIEGVHKKRTSTYIHWVSHKKELPEKYHNNFPLFRNEVGEKPQKSILEFVKGKPIWVRTQDSFDADLQRMAMALRQAFRFSPIYLAAIETAKVETSAGTYYQCNACKELFLRSKVQVDHIEPVSSVDGSPLTKDNLIDRIWTNKIQVLDKTCHTLKSKVENFHRKKNKTNRAIENFERSPSPVNAKKALKTIKKKLKRGKRS